MVNLLTKWKGKKESRRKRRSEIIQQWLSHLPPEQRDQQCRFLIGLQLFADDSYLNMVTQIMEDAMTSYNDELYDHYTKQPVQKLGDLVNHPPHYTSGKYEVIDIIEDQVGVEGFRGYCLGNVLKYVCRAGKKTESPLEDLKKAAWYLNHYINKYEEGKDE